MRAAFFFCCLSLILPGVVHSQDKGRVFLWEAHAAGGTFFLLGSVHVLKPAAYPLDERIDRVYKKCRRIVFEADPKEAAGPEMQKQLLSHGTYLDSSKLKDHVSKKTYVLLGQRMKGLGIPATRFERYRPWLCAVSLGAMEMKRLGYEPKLGIDAHFHGLAQKDGKEMIFLETARDQMGLLAEMPPERQEQLLLQAMKELEVIGKMSSEMVSAWMDGDAARMESIMDISLGKYPQIRKHLFTDRNIEWVRKIESLTKKRGGEVLVITGAGHLVGEQGILALLRKKGYTLSQY